MSGKDMLTGLSYIDRKFIEESEAEPCACVKRAESRRITRKQLIYTILNLKMFTHLVGKQMLDTIILPTIKGKNMGVI